MSLLRRIEKGGGETPQRPSSGGGESNRRVRSVSVPSSRALVGSSKTTTADLKSPVFKIACLQS